jgi:SAM-dependent methyltransferase
LEPSAIRVERAALRTIASSSHALRTMSRKGHNSNANALVASRAPLALGGPLSNEFYKRGLQYEAQHKHLTADVDFYRAIAREHGGPILELACGTGRVLVPLAGDGHEVAGLDLEESMIAVARSKLGKSAELRLGDMRHFDLGRKFRLILIAFNSIGHLHKRSDVENCFRCVKEHLSGDGLFVVSMFNPDLRLLTRRADDVRDVSRYPDPESEHEVIVTETCTYDRATQILTSNWQYTIGGSNFDTQLLLRIFFPQELDVLLHYAGFEIRLKFGSFDRTEFAADSPHQIILATAARSTRNSERCT